MGGHQEWGGGGMCPQAPPPPPPPHGFKTFSKFNMFCAMSASTQTWKFLNQKLMRYWFKHNTQVYCVNPRKEIAPAVADSSQG